jgi:HEAT repeat protein
LDGEPLLRLLAKCEVADFAAQAVRLLPGAEFWLVSQVADALWVVGDTSTERPLIQALNDFERPAMQKDRPMPEEFDIIRALGMCASETGAENVIDYINANPNLSIYVPEEVLCPLVRRRVLDVDQLAEMAVDNAGTHEYVRRACVLALGYLDTEAFAPVFLKSVVTESDELTKGHAAFFLGWAKSDRPSALEALKDLLTKAEKPYLAEQAAKSLVRLEDRNSLPSIEKTIERFGTAGSTSGLLRAVARFHASSTLQLLKKIHSDKASGSYSQSEGEMIAAFGEFYDEDQGARAVVDAALENSSFGFATRTQQIAVSILAARNPNGLLQRAATLYDEGLLDPSACGTLVNRISQLGEAKDIDTKWLIEILKRFSCDQSLSIREASSASLQWADASVRTRLYEQLEATGNEWARACAVYSLGFWDSDERVIESARFDSSPLVRRIASIASVERAKRADLKLISQSFQNYDGVARLSAYYSLLSDAPETALNVLGGEIKESETAGLYLRELRAGVQKRAKDERQKRIKEEEDEICDGRRYVSFAN